MFNKIAAKSPVKSDLNSNQQKMDKELRHLEPKDLGEVVSQSHKGHHRQNSALMMEKIQASNIVKNSVNFNDLPETNENSVNEQD